MTPPLSNLQALFLILVCAAVTFFLRAAPFLFFSGGRKSPRIVLYLGRVLPFSVIALLVVYCLKDMSFAPPAFGLPELIGVGTAALLHLWKRNNLLSVFGATFIYMLCIQRIFV